MKPIDFRNETWMEVRGRVTERMEACLMGLMMHGPCTTRVLAARMGWDILSVRPRVTDLIDLGAVDLVGREDNEGVYAARLEGEWREWFATEQRAATTGDQLLLRI